MVRLARQGEESQKMIAVPPSVARRAVVGARGARDRPSRASAGSSRRPTVLNEKRNR